MPSPYTGLVIPAVGQDAPQPLPGNVPIFQLPIDADGFNSAAFYQWAKSNADFIAYLQKVAQYRPPLANGSTIGFTAVSHVGAGTGTVVPTAPSATVPQKVGGPYSVVVKITTAGSAGGAATFAWSNDGGSTYGGNIALPAGNYTDATSGITVTFAGTFVLNDTYALQPTATPLAIFAGDDGKQRVVVDHMGLLGGRICTVEENWDTNFTVPAATGYQQISTLRRWNAGTDVNASIAQKDPNDGGSFSHPTAKIIPGTANTNFAQINSERVFSGAFTGLAAKLEFEFFMSAIGANLITWTLGLGNNASNNSRAVFQKTSADTNWQYIVTDGSAGAQTGNTGIPPVANTFQRFRIEFYASGTPSGRLVRLFIDDQLVAQVAPAANFDITGQFYNGTCTGAAVSHGRLAPTRLTWGRFLDAPPL